MMTKAALHFRAGSDSRGEALSLRVDLEPKVLEFPQRGTQQEHGTIERWGRAIVQCGHSGHFRTLHVVPSNDHNRIDFGEFFIDGHFLVLKINNAREARHAWDLFAQQPPNSSTLERDRTWTLERVIEDNKHNLIWSAWFEFPQERVEEARQAVLQAGEDGVTRAEADGAPDRLVFEFKPLTAKGVVTAALACGGILLTRGPPRARE